MKNYKSIGVMIKNEDAQVIGNFIERNFPLGTMSPQSLIELARPSDSEIHHYFEWDDKIAADKFRLHQARNILLSIAVEVDGSDVRAFHNISLGEANDRMYYTFDKAITNTNLWNEVIASALREAQAWKKRYQVYKELRLISEAIEKTTEQIQKVGNNI